MKSKMVAILTENVFVRLMLQTDLHRLMPFLAYSVVAIAHRGRRRFANLHCELCLLIQITLLSQFVF